MTLEELLAREGIRDLVARYNANGDSGRFDAVMALFVDNAVMEVGTRGTPFVSHRGRDELRMIFTGAQSRVQTKGTDSPTHVRHFTATHQIDMVDAYHASGRCYFSVLTDVGLDHWGHYVDRYVREGETWKFEFRRAAVDGFSPTSLFAP